MPMQTGPSTRKSIKDTPYARRGSLIGLENLPKPSLELEKTIEEDVYKHHHDSSDDEFMTDRAFKQASKEMVHELIYSLRDDHIDGIYQNIIQHEYN